MSSELQKQSEPLWRPRDPESAPISRYRQHVNARFNQQLRNSQELHKWSVTYPHDFWIDLHQYLKIIPALPAGMEKAYDETIPMSKIPKFFEGYTLNYTENVLANCDPNATAIIGIREGESIDGERFIWRDLIECVRQARSALLRHGIRKGDRVAAYMSNNPYTIILFLAAAAMGAVFTSISPDMGAD
ncbi:hypothetical protein LTS18_006884, partial [Coniosporium uncinatum]